MNQIMEKYMEMEEQKLTNKKAEIKKDKYNQEMG